MRAISSLNVAVVTQRIVQHLVTFRNERKRSTSYITVHPHRGGNLFDISDLHRLHCKSLELRTEELQHFRSPDGNDGPRREPQQALDISDGRIVEGAEHE
jgi:hypothetical protein